MFLCTASSAWPGAFCNTDNLSPLVYSIERSIFLQDSQVIHGDMKERNTGLGDAAAEKQPQILSSLEKFISYSCCLVIPSKLGSSAPRRQSKTGSTMISNITSSCSRGENNLQKVFYRPPTLPNQLLMSPLLNTNYLLLSALLITLILNLKYNL